MGQIFEERLGVGSWRGSSVARWTETGGGSLRMVFFSQGEKCYLESRVCGFLKGRDSLETDSNSRVPVNKGKNHRIVNSIFVQM